MPFAELGTEGLLLGAVFLAVAIAVLAMGSFFGRTSGLKRRVAIAAGSGAMIGGPSGLRHTEARWSALLGRLEKVSMPEEGERIGAMRLKLLQAGFLGPHAVRNYFVIRVILAFGLPAILIANAPLLLRTMEMNTFLLCMAGLILLGLYLPALWLRVRAADRQQALGYAFPDALDMLVVCVEAGLGVDQAFGRVGSQIHDAHPLLGEQLALVSLELRAGRTRPEALKALADRTGVPEIRSFVTLLIQSEALGTSVAQTLRVQADEMRNKRMMRAEEKAHKLPVLLSVPLVLFILPTMVGVVMLPPGIRTVRDLFPALAGGG